jgi:hypothetical protein
MKGFKKEYRIIVNGKIVMRNITKRQHIVWVDIYLDRGIEFTEEIVDLI